MVTGANQGLGFTTAEGLAKLGFSVHLLCRSEQKGKDAVAKIKQSSGNSQVFLEVADVSDLASLRALADRYSSSGLPLHVLVNSAGIMCLNGRETNADGLELSFATNTLGAFALTRLLEPVLQRSHSRVIFMSSGGLYTELLEVDDMQWERRAKYDGQSQYAKDKRRMQVYAESFAERWQAQGPYIKSFCMHPGWAESVGARTAMGGLFKSMGNRIRSSEQGADTAVWLACEDESKLQNGAFYLDRAVAEKHMWGAGTQYTDQQKQLLWQKLSKLAGLPTE